MSWLFSRALVEASSVDSCMGAEPCAQLSVTLTPHKFWRNDRMMEFSRLSQFGLTLQLLTEPAGEELLTSFLAGFPARTLALPEPEPELTASEADCGDTWRGSFAKYDRKKSKWKTAQCSLLEDWAEFSETWPRWGSMRSGVSYLQPIPALPTCVSESGLLLPTPSASHCETRPAKTWNPKSQSGRSLGCMAATGRWPTPCASASKGSSPASLTRKSGASRANDRIDHAVMASDGGQLNPVWVEWLMGWPLGWTELKPLAMARFQEWKQQHGELSEAA